MKIISLTLTFLFSLSALFAQKKIHDKDSLLTLISNESVLDNSMYYLSRATDDLRNDREVVLFAVQRSGNALKYASSTLKNDKEIVKPD